MRQGYHEKLNDRNDRKKYQERIHELKRSLAAEDAAGAAAGEEQA
jgi:hypothetical protein